LISTFNKEEVDIILKIPISKYGHSDCMVWRGTASGEFSVRSAYHLETERREVTLGDCSYMPGCNPLWNLIWGMKVQNSVKVFLWRAFHNILPSKDNLNKKGMNLDPFCIVCLTEKESISHVIWDCPSVLDVWSMCGRKI
jgi:hypothetical protein